MTSKTSDHQKGVNFLKELAPEWTKILQNNEFKDLWKYTFDYRTGKKVQLISECLEKGTIVPSEELCLMDPSRSLVTECWHGPYYYEDSEDCISPCDDCLDYGIKMANEDNEIPTEQVFWKVLAEFTAHFLECEAYQLFKKLQAKVKSVEGLDKSFRD